MAKRCRGGVQQHVLMAQMTEEEMALDQASTNAISYHKCHDYVVILITDGKVEVLFF